MSVSVASASVPVSVVTSEHSRVVEVVVVATAVDRVGPVGPVRLVAAIAMTVAASQCDTGKC